MSDASPWVRQLHDRSRVCFQLMWWDKLQVYSPKPGRFGQCWLAQPKRRCCREADKTQIQDVLIRQQHVQQLQIPYSAHPVCWSFSALVFLSSI